MVLFLAGMADNVLKPLMLGRGVDAPMPVILLGALGGMATLESWGCSSSHSADAGLSDLHGLGASQPKRRAGSGGKQRAVGALNCRR